MRWLSLRRRPLQLRFPTPSYPGEAPRLSIFAGVHLDPANMTIEELMNVKVFSASRHPQNVEKSECRKPR
jgi:hypothetical protein